MQRNCAAGSDAMVAQGRPLAIVALLADTQELRVGLDRLVKQVSKRS